MASNYGERRLVTNQGERTEKDCGRTATGRNERKKNQSGHTMIPRPSHHHLQPRTWPVTREIWVCQRLSVCGIGKVSRVWQQAKCVEESGCVVERRDWPAGDGQLPRRQRTTTHALTASQPVLFHFQSFHDSRSCQSCYYCRCTLISTMYVVRFSISHTDCSSSPNQQRRWPSLKPLQDRALFSKSSTRDSLCQVSDSLLVVTTSRRTWQGGGTAPRSR